MTHRGPFQPVPFCNSVILWQSRKIDTYHSILMWQSRHLNREKLGIPLLLSLLLLGLFSVQQWAFAVPAAQMMKQSLSLLWFLLCTLSPHTHWSKASRRYLKLFQWINFDNNVSGLLSVHAKSYAWWSPQVFLNTNFWHTFCTIQWLNF